MTPLHFLLRFSPFAGRTVSARRRNGAPALPTGSRAILENLPIGVFLVNPDGRLLYANPALAALLGYATMADFPADPSILYFNPDERREWLERLFKEGQVRDQVLRMRRSDGRVIWVAIDAVTVRDAAGNLQYFEGALTDITDRIQTEETVRQMTTLLSESEARYLGLFENSPVALWEEDFSGVKAYLEALKERGVTDFKSYLDENPQAIDACMALVRVDDVNQTTLHFYCAHTKRELLANLGTVLGPEARDIFYDELLTIAAGGTTFESEGQNRTLDGEVIDILLRWAVAPGYESSYGKVFVSTFNITERKIAERRERARARRSAALARISREIVEVGLDANAVYTTIVQRVASELGDACALGILNEEKTSVNVVAFRHRDRRAQRRLIGAIPVWPEGLAEDILREVTATGNSVYLPQVSAEQLAEIAPTTETNFAELFPLTSLIVAPLGTPGSVTGVLAALRERPGEAYMEEDVAFLNRLAGYTALTILNAQLHDLVRRQAQTDAMTGIHNRSYFISLAEAEFERSRRYKRPLSAVMFDLDYFKAINDTYGHPAGDAVLADLARRCRAAVRAYDIFGRYGGEEFMVILPETGMDGALVMAERLRQAVGGENFEVEGQSIHVTISLGVATTNELTPTLPALLAQADAAMYAAKRSGRNRAAK